MSEDTLMALQTRLQAHILHGHRLEASPALADVLHTVGPGAAHRLGIYHHAYRARLRDTLRDSFGHTLAYLGDAWFDALALEHIEATPSAHPNLRWYGQGFPAHLAERLSGPDSPAGAHPEVAELARLDWALRHAFDAADAPLLGPGELAALPPEVWTTQPLCPHPSVAVLHLAHNTLALWHALDQDQAVPPAEALREPVGVLVWRWQDRPHFRSLAPDETHALQGLLAGHAFVTLCETLAERFPQADTATVAATLLRRWLDEGVLARA